MATSIVLNNATDTATVLDAIYTAKNEGGKITFRLSMYGYNRPTLEDGDQYVPHCWTDVTIDLGSVLAVARKAQRGKSGRAKNGGITARRVETKGGK